jgi:hypothetical protein
MVVMVVTVNDRVPARGRDRRDRRDGRDRGRQGACEVS